ncbi:CHC2 zinc finger domain-containing protein [Candidatus Vidania fulgoroideorum]
MNKIINNIKKYLILKKKNKKYWAICPFHKEKTPSFLINVKEKYFYCFGCKKNGKLLYLLYFLKKKKYNKYNKLILKILKKNSINNFFLKKQLKKRKYKFNSKIKRFIFSSNNIKFRSFLKKKTIKFFLKKKIFKLDNLNRINFYNNSLIIPIIDCDGIIISFSIRRVNGKPKYFFSKNFFKFSKKNTIFGYYELFKNKFYNKDEIYVVEGFFDFFRLYYIGIKNSVSIMGSDISKKQFFDLYKSKKKIIFLMDNDYSGFIFYYNFLKKKYNLNNKYLKKTYYLKINKGDPDIFFKNYNIKKFLKYSKFNRINIFEFILLNLEYFRNFIFFKIFLKKNIKLFYKKARFIK